MLFLLGEAPMMFWFASSYSFGLLLVTVFDCPRYVHFIDGHPYVN